ncbi:hypothetical protein ACLB6G_19890 [Zhengella sp. ZM62]|uniref:hypothetical protein n=1 Tax=Zhengella sedimenti TaxID=3390035 RepID=UPI0039761296
MGLAIGDTAKEKRRCVKHRRLSAFYIPEKSVCGDNRNGIRATEQPSQQNHAGKRRHCPGCDAPAAFLNGIVHEWSCLAVTPQVAAGKTACATREADRYAPMPCNASRKTAQKRLAAFSAAAQHEQHAEMFYIFEITKVYRLITSAAES